MKFEDLNHYDGTNTFYPVCNENLLAWRKALEGISVERAAGICSGGEVSFFAVFPHVQEELLLIDHCYGSLYFAIGKYELIKEESVETSHALFSTPHNTTTHLKLNAAFTKANKGLPTANTNRIRRTRYINTSSIWQDISQQEISDFKERQDRISFIHGDINDLEAFGPFDLVYLSNALEYSGRNARNFYVDKLVKPGGYVCFTHSTHRETRGISPEWKIIQQFIPARSPGNQFGYGMNWVYTVLQTPQ